ncbi:hypothetical protein DFH28DRAFT_273683 [Melampsora americana]|nr:hypothetical protein DFH28DRAFT_273683 [Melampsora americana]
MNTSVFSRRWLPTSKNTQSGSNQCPDFSVWLRASFSVRNVDQMLSDFFRVLFSQTGHAHLHLKAIAIDFTQANMALHLSFKLSPSNPGKCIHCRNLSQSSLNCGRKLESPRIPLIRPTFIKSVSPLVDPESPLSLPETEVDRLRWLDRFTPRWNESSSERRRRLKKRAENMRTRKAHTEKILNSFQRLDSYTSTVLPSVTPVCSVKQQPAPISHLHPVRRTRMACI